MSPTPKTIGTLTLALAVLFVGLAGTASAALVGLERIGPATASDSSNKSITATCPAGKQLVGAGGDVTPGNGHVLIEDIRPSPDLTKLTVKAVEDETGTTDTWFVQAFAICAQAPPGLQRVSATSANNSATKSVVVSCPTGKRVLGAGGDINTSNGQILLDDLRPNSTLANVTLNAREDETGNSASWSLTAYAICANPVAGLERVSATSGSDSSTSKVIQEPCPAGKQVVGGGGDINSSNGQVVLDAFFPDAALTTYGAAAFEDDTGNPANWSVTTYAICANSAVRSVDPSGADSDPKLMNAPCPAGTQPTGAGGEITGGLGQVALKWISPFTNAGGPQGVQAFATEDDDGTTANWSLRAYAICATTLPGYQLVEAASPTDNASPKSVTATCPAGKRVVGAGGRVDAPGTHVPMQQFTPNPALTSVTATGVEDEDGTTNNWWVTAKAICATAPPGLQLVSATSEFHSEGEVKAVSASCPAGKNLLGTGAGIPGGAGQVLLDDVLPNATLTRVLVTGVEDQNGFAGDWGVTAYAICANP